MIKCPSCGRMNNEGEQICVYCGTPLVNLQTANETRALEDTDFEEGIPKWGSARFGKNMTLTLHVVDTRQTFIIEAAEMEEIIVGRKDPNTGDAPQVDLTASGAMEKGVSRQHAKVILRDGALHIVDNDSVNGTYLNGQKLVAKQPRVLRDGDDIRLGHLVVRLEFGSSPTSTTSSPPNSASSPTSPANPIS